ncbi:PglZ domain-containing protein [Hyphobacterium sp. CCMP332]|nr:PglZ domain-containing protein [Hyphobacterium sp. CCMP332]
MQRYNILWADDEIDLLKPHILFLEQKGYDVTSVTSGTDAIEKCEENNYDVVFLDENMPGLTGLEALNRIKSFKPSLPIVMITKSEEEYIMEEAIGSKISDYLIKPLNPNQILLSVKKILDNKRLVSERTNQSYRQEFQEISMRVGEDLSHDEWADIYKKLIFWEREIEQTENKSMSEVIEMQKVEANINFSRFVMDNYKDWLNDPNVERPLLSHMLLKKKVFPLIKKGEPLFFILIDNLRYDQWKEIETQISALFNIVEDSSYYSILPTTTAYSRNAIFSGLMPKEMERMHPELWVNEEVEEGKNLKEAEFLEKNLKRAHLDIKYSYHKILNQQHGKQLMDAANNLLSNELNAVVFNFVDMLSHARTDMEMIRQLAPDEAAYLSLTKSWFEHSSLLELLKFLSQKKVKTVITTDHGTIRVKKPFKIVGDRNVNTNLRYKVGRNLGFEEKNVVVVRNPEDFQLPKQYVSSSYVFAIEDYFFAYPNNFNYYVKYFTDTFQHGGISLEEMIIPYIQLEPK